MAEEDPTSFNIRSPEASIFAPLVDFSAILMARLSMRTVRLLLMGPAYDDMPAASGAAHGILNSLREYRRGRSDGPAWMGKPAGIPAGWNGRIQFDRLLEIAPWVK